MRAADFYTVRHVKHLECKADGKHLTFLPDIRGGHQENGRNMPGNSDEDQESDEDEPMLTSTSTKAESDRSQADPQRPIRPQVKSFIGHPI